jgi:sarcosine oxidase subunit gamma
VAPGIGPPIAACGNRDLQRRDDMAEPRRASAPPLRFAEVGSLGKLLLRGRPETTGAILEAAGWPLPGAVNRAVDGEGGRIATLGPDEHLLVMARPAVADAKHALADRLADRHHALVDVSARLVAVELASERTAAGSAVSADWPARATLAAACPLDFDIAAFAPGAVSRTVLGKAEIILDCLADDRFRLYTNRSLAAYVHLLLAEAGREFGLDKQVPA